MHAHCVFTQHGDDGVVNEVGGIAHAAYNGYKLPAEYFFHGLISQYDVVEQAYEEGQQNGVDLQRQPGREIPAGHVEHEQQYCQCNRRHEPFFEKIDGYPAHIKIGYENAYEEMLDGAVETEERRRIIILQHHKEYDEARDEGPAHHFWEHKQPEQHGGYYVVLYLHLQCPGHDGDPGRLVINKVVRIAQRRQQVREQDGECIDAERKLCKENTGHNYEVGRLQPGNPAYIVLLEVYFFAVVDVVMRKRHAKYKAADSKKERHAAVEIDKEPVEHIVAAGIVGEFEVSFLQEVAADMEQGNQRKGKEPHTVYFGEIELVCGDPPEFT